MSAHAREEARRSARRFARHVTLTGMAVACERAYALARRRERAARESGESARGYRGLTALVRTDRTALAADALGARHVRLSRLLIRSFELTHGARCPCGRLENSLACARAHPWTEEARAALAV